jgi:hypothetical protein
MTHSMLWAPSRPEPGSFPSRWASSFPASLLWPTSHPLAMIGGRSQCNPTSCFSLSKSWKPFSGDSLYAAWNTCTCTEPEKHRRVGGNMRQRVRILVFDRIQASRYESGRDRGSLAESRSRFEGAAKRTDYKWSQRDGLCTLHNRNPRAFFSLEENPSLFSLSTRRAHV